MLPEGRTLHGKLRHRVKFWWKSSAATKFIEEEVLWGGRLAGATEFIDKQGGKSGKQCASTARAHRQAYSSVGRSIGRQTSSAARVMNLGRSSQGCLLIVKGYWHCSAELSFASPIVTYCTFQ